MPMAMMKGACRYLPDCRGMDTQSLSPRHIWFLASRACLRTGQTAQRSAPEHVCSVCACAYVCACAVACAWWVCVPALCLCIIVRVRVSVLVCTRVSYLCVSVCMRGACMQNMCVRACACNYLYDHVCACACALASVMSLCARDAQVSSVPYNPRNDDHVRIFKRGLMAKVPKRIGVLVSTARSATHTAACATRSSSCLVVDAAVCLLQALAEKEIAPSRRAKVRTQSAPSLPCTSPASAEPRSTCTAATH